MLPSYFTHNLSALTLLLQYVDDPLVAAATDELESDEL